eukprot:scaffold10570_cov176-Amphora_coffeaeformis.AAC.36
MRGFILLLCLRLSPSVRCFPSLPRTTSRRARPSDSCSRTLQCIPSTGDAFDISDDTAESKHSSKARINPTVRQHMKFLQDRLDVSASDKGWKKTRSYLYKTNLSPRQVQNVVETLIQHDNLPKELVRHVIQSSPRILRKNVRTHLEPTLEFLRSLFGEEMFAEAIKRNPDLLLTQGMGYNGDELELVEVFLRQHLGAKDSEIDKLKRTAPRVFQLPLSTVLATTAYLSDILKEGGIEEDSLGRVLVKTIMSHPPLLHLSVESNLKPRMEYLQKRCGLGTADISVLIKSCSAGILALSVEDNLAAKLDKLENILSEPDQLRKCLARHPQILGLSAENLQAKIDYFNEIEQNLAARLLERCPAVFSLSLADNLEPKVDFLARVWGVHRKDCHGEDKPDHGTFDPRFASLLYEYPTILTLSLDGNLRPTVDFFNRTGYVRLDEQWKLKDPKQTGYLRGRYMAASLYNRLMPRWHFARSNTRKDTQLKNQDDNDLQIPLHLLVSGSDAAFCEAIGISIEKFEEFKTDTVARLKFNDQFSTWLKTGRPIEV